MPRETPLFMKLIKGSTLNEKTGCWEWQGCKKEGYGMVCHRGRTVTTHRASFKLFFNTEIPKPLELDHTCRVRSCINPLHLEPVTHRENVSRSPLLGLGNLKKTHCPKGHAYEGKNLYVTKTRSRLCKACGAARKKLKGKNALSV